ncbi:hypothetical protein B0H12DRAFT_97670 [Mycena haematopus]|nr:hypothetical protein B0H12DRAFT_97670 [Mycena haematopus]
MADFSTIQNTLSVLTATLQQLIGVHSTPATPPAPTLPAPIPVLPTPPITSYTSSRAQALPASSHGHPAASTQLSSHQPILGVAGLGINLAGHANNPRVSGRTSSQLTAPQISQANTGRRDAIAAHFQPTPALVQRRRRGAAVHPPALTRGPPPTLLELVSFLDTNGTRMMKIRMEVLPPTTPAGGDQILCRRLRTSELGFLTDHHLLHHFVLSENTLVVDLIRMTARAMQDGPGKYDFDTVTGTRASRHLPHETLPLNVLTLVNKGNPRTNGVSYLSSRHPVGQTMTIGEFTLPKNRSKFGHPTLCVENTDDGIHLIVRAAIRRAGIRFTAAEEGAWPRIHTCLSIRHSHYIDEATEGDFPDDSDSTEILTSGGEPDSASEDEDENMPDVLAPAPTPDPNALPSRRALASIQPVVRAQSLQEFGIPSRIFVGVFIPQPGPYRDVFEAHDPIKAVYELASGGVRVTPLVVEGLDHDSMVLAYKTIIGKAVDADTYNIILSPRRTFRRLRPDGTTLSIGIGPEMETLYGLYQTFALHPEKYFIQREEGRHAISTTISMAQRFLVSPARIRELKILGVVLVLMLIQGIVPDIVSPALFQFAFHGCDLNAITRTFLAEWYPALLLVDRWIQTGPRGDLSPFQAHFATYHDLQVASLESRDQAQHDALGADILYGALFSPQPPSHPELKALFSGMAMACPSGFSMPALFRSFPGGTERLLSEKWASLITDFASIEQNLELVCPAAVDLAQIMTGLPFIVNPVDLFRDFLQRTGVPCPRRFDSVKSTIHPIVPLSRIDTLAFRPQMLAWACTGVPSVELTKNIYTYFALPGCPQYHSDTGERDIHMAGGTIVFRSCHRSAHIPLPYLVELHQSSYPTIDEHGQPTEPLTLQDAIDDWLLTQIITAISDLTIL